MGSRLMAKSAKGNRPGRSLVGHSCDVIEAFEALFGTACKPTELASHWASFFGLRDIVAFVLNGLAAAADHDWGKTGDGFQAMLRHQGRQLLRHEQVSAILLTLPDVWDWLGGNDDLDRPLILSAVVCHHLKARDVEFGQPQAEADTLMRLRWEDEEFQLHLSEIAPKLSLAKPVPQAVPRIWSFEPIKGVADLVGHRSSSRAA